MLIGMPAEESVTNAAQNQLHRVLGSAGFSRNERLSRFLQFVVEQHLAGRDGEIKESVIAVEVFGRGTDYDSKQDSIVRTEAARLRARLSEYYLGEGKQDALVIELPKGGYVPVIRSPVIEPAVTSPVLTNAPPPDREHRSQIVLALAGVLVLAVILGLWWFQRVKAPVSIAVLPLTNLSQEPGSDYFADGLTDEIIRNLSIIEGLAVRSQTSSFAFKGKPRNVREAGNQLQADYIVEGSVLRAGQKLRINAQLVRVRDDFALWSARYDRELPDALAIQDEISRGIVNSLRLKLGRGRRRYEINAEVYDAYLHARALSIERGLKGINESIGSLEDVVAKDPTFAPAYADLAAAYAARSGQLQFNIPSEVAKLRVAANKAIQLDPLLAQAQYAQAMLYARDAQWEQAEKAFLRAIEIDPGRSEMRYNFATFLLMPLGRVEEALVQMRKAERSDPLAPMVHYCLAYVLTSARLFDEAAVNCAKLPADGFDRNGCLGRARLGQGRVSEAIDLLEAAIQRGVEPGNQMRGELGYAYARAGRREDAEKLAASISPLNPFNHALIYAGLGDKERTFAALEKAAAAGPFRMGRTLTFPEFDLLRGDPRVHLLHRNVGLPE